MTRIERFGKPRSSSVLTAEALLPVSPDSRMRTDGLAADWATAWIWQTISLSVNSSVVNSSDCLTDAMSCRSLGFEFTGLHSKSTSLTDGVSEADGGGLVCQG